MNPECPGCGGEISVFLPNPVEIPLAYEMELIGLCKECGQTVGVRYIFTPEPTQLMQ